MAGPMRVRIKSNQPARADRWSAPIRRLSNALFAGFASRYSAFMRRARECGFTLYELMITLVIVGVILSFGIPNLAEFAQNSRITSTANDLHGSFLLARSEAVRAKSIITICASVNPLAADADCGGAFDDGWIVFVDLNGDLVRSGSGENVLRTYPPVPNGIDIVSNGESSYFSFAPTGLGRGDVGGEPALQTARICDGRGNVIAAGGSSAARFLVATPLGRTTILRDVAQIDAAGGCP